MSGESKGLSGPSHEYAGIRCVAVFMRRTLCDLYEAGPNRRGYPRAAAESLERQIAVVLLEEAEETLVIVGRHVEQPDQQAVTAVRLDQAGANDHPHVVPGDVARHERRVGARPERFLLSQALDEGVDAGLVGHGLAGVDRPLR